MMLMKTEVYSYLYFLGVSFSDLGRKEDAIKEFTKAIEINP